MVTKRTVDEILEAYLKAKGIVKENIASIKEGLHSRIEKAKGKEKKPSSDKKAKITHGTSCPRIMTNDEELLIEM